MGNDLGKLAMICSALIARAIPGDLEGAHDTYHVMRNFNKMWNMKFVTELWEDSKKEFDIFMKHIMDNSFNKTVNVQSGAKQDTLRFMEKKYPQRYEEFLILLNCVTGFPQDHIQKTIKDYQSTYFRTGSL